MDGEKSIEQYLVKKVRDAGGRAYKFVSPGNSGVPDRLVIFPSGAVIFCELKCAGGRLSALQKNQIGRLRELKQTVGVIHSKEEIDRLVSEFGGEI